jgi:hypothetical protein
MRERERGLLLTYNRVTFSQRYVMLKKTEMRTTDISVGLHYAK